MDSQSGYTALHIAASHGHLETSKVLLKYGASLTRECHGSLRTPFSRSSRLPMMSRPHVTSLHIAAARRNIPMCRAMLQAHVKPPPLKILSTVLCSHVTIMSEKDWRFSAALLCRTKPFWQRMLILLPPSKFHKQSKQKPVVLNPPRIHLEWVFFCHNMSEHCCWYR